MDFGNLHTIRSWDIFLFLQLVRAQYATAKFVKVFLGQQMGTYIFKPFLLSKAEHLRWGRGHLLLHGLVVATLTAFAEVIWHNIKSPVRTKWGVSVAVLHHVLCHSHVISYHPGAWWPHWEGKCHCARCVPSWTSRGGKLVVAGRQGKQIQISAWDFSASRKKYLEWRFLSGRDSFMEMLKVKC